ncbi:MAG: hydrogenase maturation protease [Chloroflexi bacterium]|nr:hydrogenase maturation protease [Chloroflexota bacterium]
MLIIGVGNSFRGDDAAGLIAAQRLRDLALPGVTVLEQSGEGAALMAAWEDASRVVLIDAVSSGGEPGFVHRIEAGERPLPTQLFNSFSSHAFGVAEAVEMARLLDKLPPKLIVFGIEGKSFELGNGLSAEVEAGVETAVRQIQQDILSTLHL